MSSFKKFWLTRLGQMSRPQLICAGLLMGFLCPLFWGGCSLQQPPQEQQVSDLDHFESRAANDAMKGVVIGAPRANAERGSAEYAKAISEQTGAGLLIASGFASRRLAVTQPLVRSTPALAVAEDLLKRGNIYRNFKSMLRQTAQGNVKLYIGVRLTPAEKLTDRMEVAASGFTFEELEILRESFLRIRDRLVIDEGIPKVSIAIDPLEKLSWRVTGMKHHGVLMSAERGLNLRLPQILSAAAAKAVYARVLSLWINETLRLIKNPGPQIEVKLLDQGRIESIASRTERAGVVIGAPHGTFDEHTAELVEQVSYRTGLAAVIAKGFTPTECAGWRINVNRPTETRYPTGEIEINSERAQVAYRAFKEALWEASQNGIGLYIDVHQNGRQSNIEVATVGISRDEASLVKKTYREMRDRFLKNAPGVAAVDLLIEPLDNIEIGAWGTKAHGILSVAKKSLHFEFPLYGTLGSTEARKRYTEILAALLDRIVADLATPQSSVHAMAEQ
ncbi:MAG: hypothetical protein WCH75_26190 [Candidatus Binatia bacterium]